MIDSHTQFHAYLSIRSMEVSRRSDTETNALAFARELVVEQRACTSKRKRQAIELVQLMLAAEWMHRHYLNGDATRIGNWVGWSMSPDVREDHTATFELSRIDTFMSVDVFNTWPDLHSWLVMYFSSFYYYARVRTAMKNIAEAFWENALEVFLVSLKIPTNSMQHLDIMVGTCMLEWAAKESDEYAKSLSSVIELAAEDVRIPAHLRYVFHLSLCTNAGKYSAVPPEARARKTLAEFESFLPIEYKVQLMATSLDVSDDQCFGRFLIACEQAQTATRERVDSVEFEKVAGRTFDNVTPVIRKLLEANNVSGLTRLLQTWYLTHGLRKAGGDSGLNLLYWVPFDESGFYLAYGSTIVHGLRDSQRLLERLTHATNAFLSTAKTVAYGDNSQLQIPERPGVPAVEELEGYEATLFESFCPAIADDCVEQIKDVTGQLVLPAEANPIQAVQLSRWGVSWPIAASLSPPKVDAEVRKALLWSGGGSFTEESELEFVAEALRSAGVKVEVVISTNNGSRSFLTAYERPELDLIWVSSHGHFDHWHPENVQLQASHDGASIGLIDLLSRTPSRERRRLLVLNVCDGSRFKEGGPVPRVGLGPSLAAPDQATISHLWPVTPFASAAFGACLSLELAQGAAFFAAYTRALQSMRKPAKEIGTWLRSKVPEHIQLPAQLERRSDDFKPIQIWGSAAFMQ